jgi:hypothetical protein
LVWRPQTPSVVNPPVWSYAVTVQAGQGSPITISVPVAPEEIETPYALTGQDATPRNLQWHTMQYGQGGLIWIAE